MLTFREYLREEFEEEEYEDDYPEATEGARILKGLLPAVQQRLAKQGREVEITPRGRDFLISDPEKNFTLVVSCTVPTIFPRKEYTVTVNAPWATNWSSEHTTETLKRVDQVIDFIVDRLYQEFEAISN